MTNDEQEDWKVRNKGALTSSGSAASMQSSAYFVSGKEKDNHGRNECFAYTEDTPIDWDGLVNDVIKCEFEALANDVKFVLQGKKSKAN